MSAAVDSGPGGGVASAGRLGGTGLAGTGVEELPKLAQRRLRELDAALDAAVPPNQLDRYLLVPPSTT
jgi:hypothetical protein